MEKKQFIFSILFLSVTPTLASVKMLNTRVIYPSQSEFQTIRFANPDEIPYLVEVWTDKRDIDSTPDTADGSFLAIPNMFRINPKSEQSIRLVFNGRSLPDDRETLFHLNSYQVPPKNVSNGESAPLIIKNRNRIFYRPANIIGNVENVPHKLIFTISKSKNTLVMNIKNPTSFYSSLTSAEIECGDATLKFAADLVPPRSTKKWSVTNNKPCKPGHTIRFKTINDFGGIMQFTSSVN